MLCMLQLDCCRLRGLNCHTVLLKQERRGTKFAGDENHSNSFFDFRQFTASVVFYLLMAPFAMAMEGVIRSRSPITQIVQHAPCRYRRERDWFLSHRRLGRATVGDKESVLSLCERRESF
jgi:hypothetical protein